MQGLPIIKKKPNFAAATNNRSDARAVEEARLESV